MIWSFNICMFPFMKPCKHYERNYLPYLFTYLWDLMPYLGFLSLLRRKKRSNKI